MTITGLRGDPCRENFWSAACWFGAGGSQALGIDSGPGTIGLKPLPVSNCAGTLNADGSCTAAPGVNDPEGTAVSSGNFNAELERWAAGLSSSANVPGNNTAGTGALWIAGGVLVLLFLVGRSAK